MPGRRNRLWNLQGSWSCRKIRWAPHVPGPRGISFSNQDTYSAVWRYTPKPQIPREEPVVSPPGETVQLLKEDFLPYRLTALWNRNSSTIEQLPQEGIQ